MIPGVVEMRRHLHRHPELAFRETRTAAYVERELRALALEPCHPTPTSVLARLRTGRPGPVLVLRADLDALPVGEETGLPFASEVDGVMHACGHDGHTAVLLAVARVVAGLGEDLRGEVRFVFQHAEEPIPSGAPELVAAGVLDGATAVAGLHLWSPLPTGQVAVPAGPLMASTDYVDIVVSGRGGHGGIPHEVVDPVAAAAQVITGLQHLVARETDPLQPAVVSVTGVDAGRSHNVVPERVTLHGTVRALDESVRHTLLARIDSLASGVATAHRASAETTVSLGPPAVTNDAALAELARSSVDAVLGAEACADIQPVLAGEDFAHYQREVPGVFLLVGAGGPDAYPHHHPRFDIDETALEPAVRVMTDLVARVCR